MKIAVVGGGISGISAAYHLQHNHEVTLIETSNKIGGHANSIPIEDEALQGTQIDTGFIVFNDRNYPSFRGFLDNLEVTSVKTDMSFSHLDQENNIGYAGSVRGLTPSISKILSLQHWLRIKGIHSYSKTLASFKEDGLLPNTTIGDFLRELGCPTDIMDNYFIPMASAIWSCDQASAYDIPSQAFVDFFSNHGLLGFKNRPTWYAIEGGSRVYLEAFRHAFKGDIQVNQKVSEILETGSEVIINTPNDRNKRFDFAVVATHADTALQILPKLPENKRTLLLKHHYAENEVVLHSDESLMPQNKRLWASWNVTKQKGGNGDVHFQTSYYMNRLQRLKSKRIYVVTINPAKEPAPDLTLFRTKYSHPLLLQDNLSHLQDFDCLNRGGRILFCGSYLGYGFHEDGFNSGLKVAEILQRREG